MAEEKRLYGHLALKSILIRQIEVFYEAIIHEPQMTICHVCDPCDVSMTNTYVLSTYARHTLDRNFG